ncbi:MAG TPA: UxaA family hydrolase [Bryobacteraceae bacterium]|nr:UxaA family hydrolase [Bryobacteraceae bacterium]
MIHFIVHDEQDSVGVVVIDVEKGQQVAGWNMRTDDSLELTAKANIPLGHKIALTPIATGTKVIKYNVPIGNATQDIDLGDHVHTHNLKTARW